MFGRVGDVFEAWKPTKAHGSEWHHIQSPRHCCRQRLVAKSVQHLVGWIGQAYGQTLFARHEAADCREGLLQTDRLRCRKGAISEAIVWTGAGRVDNGKRAWRRLGAGLRGAADMRWDGVVDCWWPVWKISTQRIATGKVEWFEWAGVT